MSTVNHSLVLTSFTTVAFLDTMKAFTLLLTILSAADIAAAEKFLIGPPGWAQSIGINTTEPEDYHILSARQAKGQGMKTVLKNRTPHIKNSKSVKVRYGPFTIRGGGAYVLFDFV